MVSLLLAKAAGGVRGQGGSRFATPGPCPGVPVREPAHPHFPPRPCNPKANPALKHLTKLLTVKIVTT